MSQQCGGDSNALYTSGRLHSTTLADLPLHGLAAVVPKNFHFQSYHLQLIAEYLGAKNFHWQWYRIAALHLVSSLERPIFSQMFVKADFTARCMILETRGIGMETPALKD